MIFKHSDLLIVGAQRVHVGTVSGYAAQYHENTADALARARKHRHELWWLGLQASVLCGDKGYYERDRATWANVPRVDVGDIIQIEDSEGVHTLQIQPAPNRNYRLVEVK